MFHQAQRCLILDDIILKIDFRLFEVPRIIQTLHGTADQARGGARGVCLGAAVQMAVPCVDRPCERRRTSPRLRRSELQPDVVAYSAAIAACEEGFRWMRALSFLKQMDQEGG